MERQPWESDPDSWRDAECFQWEKWRGDGGPPRLEITATRNSMFEPMPAYYTPEGGDPAVVPVRFT